MMPPYWKKNQTIPRKKGEKKEELPQVPHDGKDIILCQFYYRYCTNLNAKTNFTKWAGMWRKMNQ